MALLVVTGAGGLIGSETVRFFHAKGFDIVGIDNDMPAYFFGSEASTSSNVGRLAVSCFGYRHESIDIRDQGAVNALFRRLGREITAVVHTAA